MPWRQNLRDVDPGVADPSGLADGGVDDLGAVALVILLILLAILAPFILIAFLAVAAFVLLLALLPLFLAARLGWAMTWTVLGQARRHHARNPQAEGVDRVRRPHPRHRGSRGARRRPALGQPLSDAPAERCAAQASTMATTPALVSG